MNQDVKLTYVQLNEQVTLQNQDPVLNECAARLGVSLFDFGDIKPSYMLETPKVSCTFRTSCDIINNKYFERENQENNTMGNQQERFEIDLSWLAGIIEGEGWVSLILYSNQQKKGNKTPAFTPCIGVTNCDINIINKVKELFDKLNIVYRYQTRKAHIGKDGSPRKEKYEISAISKKNVRVLGNAILPYMYGEKKERVKKVLQFLDLRDSKPSSGNNSSYGIEEFEIYNSLYSYKGKSRSKILNDFTLGLLKKENDKV